MRNAVDLLKKLTVLSVVGLVMFMMWGCLDDPVSDDDSVTITLTNPPDSLTVGITAPIAGSVEASPDIDHSAFTFSVTSGTTDATSHFDIDYVAITASDNIDLTSDLALTIEALTTVTSGTYTFNISVTAGSATSSKSFDFGVNSGTVIDTNVVTIQDTLGSWNNSTYGSSLDADLMVIYKVADASTNCAEIDVWYSNEAFKNRVADVFYSPKQAGVALHPPKDWTTQNETQMAIVTCDFDTVVNQAQIDAIWTAATDKKQLLRLTAGQIVVLQTNAGANRLIKFVSGETSNTGICVFKGKKPE